MSENTEGAADAWAAVQRGIPFDPAGEDSRSVVPFGSDPARYRSYLLRLWREEPGTPWRCQVRCVGSSRVLRFDGERRLFEFLEAELGCADGIGSRRDDMPGMDEGRPAADAGHPESPT